MKNPLAGFEWTGKTPPQFLTENYVCSPPALVVVDSRGDIFTLGLVERSAYEQRRLRLEAAGWEFQVMRNAVWTGEWAAKIERRDGRISIFGDYGKARRKQWNGQSFV